MSEKILLERAKRVEDAFRLLQGSKDSLGNIPGILRQLVSMRVWEGYEWQGKSVTFSSFREFVETSPPEGLGTTIADLVGYCKKYPEIADLIDLTVQEQTPSYRPPKRGDNIPPLKKAKGTSFQRSLRRLRNMAQENPQAAELREQVLRGEISANHALRKLGVRKARYGVEASPESVAAFASKHLSKKQREKLVDLLSKDEA